MKDPLESCPLRLRPLITLPHVDLQGQAPPCVYQRFGCVLLLSVPNLLSLFTLRKDELCFQNLAQPPQRYAKRGLLFPEPVVYEIFMVFQAR